jgi:hypothetical protein
MAQKSRPTQQEVVTISAEAFAGTIDVEAMGITVEEVDIEGFCKHFAQKANEMFEAKDYLLLSIGPAINTDGDGIYSNDMQKILDYIEENMHTKFYFHYGLMLWIGKDSISPCWLPH